MLAFERQAPIGYRPELGAEAGEYEQRIKRNGAQGAVGSDDVQGREPFVKFLEADGLRGNELDAALLAHFHHLRDRGGHCLELVAPVHQGDAGSSIWLDESQCCFKC